MSNTTPLEDEIFRLQLEKRNLTPNDINKALELKNRKPKKTDPFEGVTIIFNGVPI